MALVEFPTPGLKAFGFITGRITTPDATECYRVFIPTSPNPTTGYFQLVPIDRCEILDMSTEEAFRLNVAPVARFCELLPESVPLLFVSSDYVFEGIAPPYREEDERRPVSEYGRMKVEAEDLVLQRDMGLVLRIPLLIGAGPTQSSKSWVA